MRIFLDTEFIEDGRTIEPLSIGMVREDDKEYYVEVASNKRLEPNEWVLKNVIPHLQSWDTWVLDPFPKYGSLSSNKGAKIREVVRQEIIDFCDGEQDPEFWGYFADYDWVLLCQLFGTMMDLPNRWPKYCLDIRQEMKIQGITKSQIISRIGEGEDEEGHNALTGARYHKKMYDILFNF